MDFPRQFLSLFAGQEGAAPHMSDLRGFIDDIESRLAAGPSREPQKDRDETAPSAELLSTVADHLTLGLISCYSQGGTDARDSILEDVDKATALVVDKGDGPENQEKFEVYILLIKNFLRWYIQVYVSERGRLIPSPFKHLQSRQMIQLYTKFLTRSVDHVSFDAKTARTVCLLLFYASYVSAADCREEIEALDELHKIQDFPGLALRLLIIEASAPLALSVTRNIHSLLVTFPEGASLVKSKTLSLKDDEANVKAEWVDQSHPEQSFQTILTNILKWCLSSDPPFPGKPDDKRSELVVEVFSVFYALRLGGNLGSAEPESLTTCMLEILQLPGEKSAVANCQTSALMLLMDSPSSFGKYLLDHGTLILLLDVFERQVFSVVDGLLVDNSATSRLVPLLVALERYASSYQEIYNVIKSRVFPPSNEFDRKSRQQGEKAKNMSPLDAPDGTFRAKLISLMTWPESNVKRCSGEFLWTLSSASPIEFVHRTGLGNAVTILGAKGLVSIPGSS